VIILTLRTDKPEAELGLYDGDNQMAYMKWQAHRRLAETINDKIDEILNESSKSLHDIQGIVCFKGPGSFTGLRIGLSVANALAYGLKIPVTAQPDPRWLEKGIDELLAGRDDKIALPEYGAPVNTTQPKK
jgi:tRNA threonylcarbamoyladenosine biosynthesis protein TsaB